jgi:2-keto-4-pentenoate hydratase/2-oxohepta-3-ene-1,7-dioic acid hydratase in catechol pathway
MLASVASFACLAAQDQDAPEYKLGTFEQNDRTFIGLVLDDSLVVDLSRAAVNAPATLKELIEGWDESMAGSLASLAIEALQERPEFAYDLSEVKTLPPIPNPGSIINAARNYDDHNAEMIAAGRVTAPATIDETVLAGIPGVWERSPDDGRGNPYVFPKLTSALNANGDPIILPPGREQIDWECELTIVVGKTAKNVSADQAAEYIFGYTIQNDVSDREDRPDGRYGSDWVLGKSHDTFAPLGPFVVPSAFVSDPMNLQIGFTLNGEVMQDANTSYMTHGVYETFAYVSNILTLHPGDLVATGTPAGVGTARTPPIYLQDGDSAVCTIG